MAQMTFIVIWACRVVMTVHPHCHCCCWHQLALAVGWQWCCVMGAWGGGPDVIIKRLESKKEEY
jgi:hypothetical protein